MKEKSSIDILIEFAKRKGFKYYTNSSVKNFHLSQNERFLSSKFVVFDLRDISDNSFIVFFDTFSSKAYTGDTYCGFYKLTEKCKNEMKILKRDWFDKLSFKKRLMTGNSFTDKNVTIFSENNEVDKFILNSEFIRKYLEISKRIMPLELLTVKNSESVVPELHGNNLIALKTNVWITDEKELEFFIEQGKILFNRLS